MSKALRIVLAFSILLNVLLIGIIIGSFSHRLTGPLTMHNQMNEMMGELPEDKRELVERTMKELHSETNETKKKIERKRDEVLEVLTAPEFDGGLFDQRVAELHELMGELVSEVASASKKIASELDQKQRIMIAEFIRRRPTHHFPPHRAWEKWEESGDEKAGEIRKRKENDNSGQ
ncbi:MAG: periplasmic heavy metal sensor [Deltaproteobacteria bacterium]